jgi:hypothetical protein
MLHTVYTYCKGGNMSKLICIVILITGVVLAESATVFDTQFNGIPNGWSNLHWEFSGSDGAYLNKWVSSPDEFIAVTGSQSGTASWYFVPDGTDSLVIHIEHDIYAMTAHESVVYIQLLSPSTANEYLFYEDLYNSYTSDEPIDLTITSPLAGNWIGFKIYADITTCYPGYSIIEWYITDLTATAYGSGMTLDTVTWADLKQL